MEGQLSIDYDLEAPECKGYDVTNGHWCCEAHELRYELAEVDEDTELF